MKKQDVIARVTAGNSMYCWVKHEVNGYLSVARIVHSGVFDAREVYILNVRDMLELDEFYDQGWSIISEIEKPEVI